MILHGLVAVFMTVVFALWVAGVIERRLMRIESLDSSLRIVGIRVAKALLTVIAIVASLSLVGIDMTALFGLHRRARRRSGALACKRSPANYLGLDHPA